MTLHPAERVVLALTLGWVVALWVWPDLAYLLVFDDAFYYFEIAERIRAGQGSTFDGVNQTNGYHPLWMAVCLLVGPTTWLGVKGVLTAQVGLLGAATATVARVVRQLDPRGAWLPALVLGGVLFGPLAFKSAVNGMETALLVALSAAIWRHAWDREGDALAGTSIDRVRFAFLASLLFLARLDAALPLFVVGLDHLVRVLRGRGTPTALALAFAPVASTILTVMAVNQLSFGGPLPISGMVKSAAPGLSGWLVLVATTTLPLALAVACEGRPQRAARWIVATRGFLVGMGVQVGYYLSFQVDARPWYFAPHLLWGATFAALAALDLVDREAKESPAAARRMTWFLAVPAVAVGLGQLAAAPVYAQQIALRRGQQELGERLDAHLVDGRRAGGWDAGLVGFTARGPVTNLDGLVNSRAFYDAARAGRSAAWVEAEGLTLFANHGIPEAEPCGQLRENVARVAGDPVAERARVVDRWEQGGFELCVLDVSGSH